MKKYIYRKVVSSRLPRLVAHLTIFRLFMKGKFDAFGQKSSKLNSRLVYSSQLYGRFVQVWPNQNILIETKFRGFPLPALLVLCELEKPCYCFNHNELITLHNIENWGRWKSQFFWVSHFDFFFQKNYFLLHSN